MGSKRVKGFNNRRGGSGNEADATEFIRQISIAAEHTRMSVMGSVAVEVKTLEAMLETDEGYATTATILQAIAAIKSDTMGKAWLAFFEVYQEYGMVPTAQLQPNDAEPENEKTDADAFAEETAGKVVDEQEERAAADDLAKQRKKMVDEGKKRH